MNDDTRTGSITAENPKEIQFPPLRFDPEAYIEYVKDADFSEKEAIWVIMTSFVDMRFGTHPFQQAIKVRNGNSTLDRDSAGVVNCRDKFSRKTKDKTAPQRRKRRRPERDS